ncbi:uncharacterized protein LOC113925755 isoform X1 [Zalophus californianus]|uniref:Uncharacterized protein LOC113925755 isoform X1 n=1 Tax=Zalophus californianus TaxID=9704 RepID=A0A6J2DKE9_ZALCA|nr:uncharacterized protein LOC113925755 isoform X1 [Zalophus californianus]
MIRRRVKNNNNNNNNKNRRQVKGWACEALEITYKRVPSSDDRERRTICVPPWLPSVRQLSESELPISHGSASGNRGSNFRPEPWGTVSLSASDVSPGCPPPTPVPPHNRKPWRHLSRCEEALTSLAATGPRTPSSCSHCGPGGLWVKRRTSAPTAARTPRDPEGSVPVTCLGPLLLTADLHFEGWEGISPRESSRKNERRKRESKFSVTL